MKIIIGIPAFNEEKNIASIITKLMNITDTIVDINGWAIRDMNGD